jgi:DNA-binding NarL/FixJ family response regulator
MALFTFLVEDNRTIRDNLIPALEDLAAARVVGFAETEKDALTWLDAHADGWQLLVVDLFLKDGSGFGVLRNCMKRTPSQRAVVLSNYVDPDMRARCTALGADAVFDKSEEIDGFFEYCTRCAS